MPDALDDTELVAQVLAGKIQQFDSIVVRYHRALLRVAESRLGCMDSAEEVVQESLMAAFRSLHTYNSKFSFRTWLWTILLNQCKRRYRRSRPIQEQDETAGHLDAICDPRGGSPPQIAIQREAHQRLNLLIDQLPDAQADALRLRFFAGLKFQEIADTMQCSLSSAKNRVRIGLTRLSEHLICSGDFEPGETRT